MNFEKIQKDSVTYWIDSIVDIASKSISNITTRHFSGPH